MSGPSRCHLYETKAQGSVSPCWPEGTISGSKHMLSQDLCKAPRATLDYLVGALTSATTARTPSFGLLGGGGPGHHGLVSGCLLGVQRAVADSLRCSWQGRSKVIWGVCEVWLLSPCHMRAPLKGVHLWVLLAAFCSLSGSFYNLKGLPEIASWFTVKWGLAFIGCVGCGCLEGLLESTQATLGVPATTATQDIRVGLVGGPGWRHVVPRIMEVRIPTISVVDENPLQVR